jgi:hypothetical protein
MMPANGSWLELMQVVTGMEGRSEREAAVVTPIAGPVERLGILRADPRAL